MFSGVISVRIRTESDMLVIRSKGRWFAEKIGFDKSGAGIISTVISEMARLILLYAKSGRIDILSIRSNMKRGINILGFFEKMERIETQRKLLQSEGKVKRTDFRLLLDKQIIDEFRIIPTNGKEIMMRITKWIN